MKMLALSLIVALVACFSLQMVAAEKTKGKKLLHVVALKFKSTATKEQIQEVETAFKDLKKKISQIHSLKCGTNVSPEKHDKGFTHGFVLAFNTEADRDAYLVHPDHKAFGKLLGPIMDDVFVIDFWTQE